MNAGLELGSWWLKEEEVRIRVITVISHHITSPTNGTARESGARRRSAQSASPDMADILLT
jgi:hypothetical protein